MTRKRIYKDVPAEEVQEGIRVEWEDQNAINGDADGTVMGAAAAPGMPIEEHKGLPE